MRLADSAATGAAASAALTAVNPYLGAASALLGSGSGGGGGGGGGAPQSQQSTVSPAIQTQVSPQISPSFVQQFQPSNSGVTTGATQNLPTSFTGQPGGAPGVPTAPGATDAFGNPVPIPTAYNPAVSPSYAPGPTSGLSTYLPWIIGGAALIAIIALAKKKRAPTVPYLTV